MTQITRRVALILDLEWPHKRHAGIFAGTQRYAREQGWESIIDEFVAETLAQTRTGSVPYKCGRNSWHYFLERS